MGVIESRSISGAVLPEQFGKYSLLGHLATGGMAEVWLARQLGMQGFEKIVVIKRARPELTDAETTRLFLDEARLVATLEHPNIAQVYEIGFVSGSYFFVMEYVDGADLRRLIETAVARRHRVGLADALYIATHVCNALHYAHEKHDLDGHALQIIHRDVSPSNVLLSRDGAIKVCDFGVAKVRSQRVETTKSGMLKGKFSYMSPEQVQSKPLDRRSDVFSIGILLYELTTMTKLFRAGNELALLQQIADARIARPSSRVPGYPAELEHIVMKALAKDPEDRYPTAQALQLELEEFARERKLAMSSVGIAALMRRLFDKRDDAWIRTARGTTDPVVEVTFVADDPDEPPAFRAVGSAPSPGASLEPSREPSQGSASTTGRTGRTGQTGANSQTGTIGATDAAGRSEPGSTTSSAIAPAPHRATALWLIGAVIAGGIAVSVSVADQMIVAAEDRATAGALAADAERIASLLDGAAQAAHMRADGIATTPMLRAAIETDAATLDDIATSEMVFSTARDQVLEVYQLRGDQPTSLLRIPKTAAALTPLRGRDTDVQSDGQALTLLAGAPIAGYRVGLAGAIMVSTQVDLSSVRRSLADHTAGATLTGLGRDLVLVARRDGAGAAPVELAVPSSGGWGTASAKLVATPMPSAGLVWAAPVRAMSGGLAGLLLLGFVVGLARRPRS
jgi:serine/threonine protein kinase